MYVPAHFSEPSIEALHTLISEHALGTLITYGSQGLDANHIPFELDRSKGELGVLHAHVARNNPVWQALATGDDVLVVFRAGEAYISPSWYPSKHVFHKQVPTWNYIVAHAHGKVTIRDDERYVRGVVAKLTRAHEAAEPQPWRMTDSPTDYIDAMLKAIVGIEIEITKLVGKSKLSQNKDAADIRGAAASLAARGKQSMSEAMRACVDDMAPSSAGDGAKDETAGKK